MLADKRRVETLTHNPDKPAGRAGGRSVRSRRVACPKEPTVSEAALSASDHASHCWRLNAFVILPIEASPFAFEASGARVRTISTAG